MSMFDRFQRNKKDSLRNMNSEVAIEVTDLVMEFKVTKDKIDTLKEYVIRTLKRNKKAKRKIRILDGISFEVKSLAFIIKNLVSIELMKQFRSCRIISRKRLILLMQIPLNL